MSVNGRAKGARGELQVRDHIEPWWRRLEPEARFIRTPGSGGWRHAQSFGARADLMADPVTCKLFPFSLEVKWKEAWSEREFLLYRRSPVWSWWEQSSRAAVEDRRRPLLWFRKNRTRIPDELGALALPATWLVMLEASVYERLRLRGQAPPLVRFDDPRHTVVLTHAQFLWFPPRSILNACNA